MDRKAQILQTLTQMLEQPRERVTTAALAAQVQVSEAALYRHFASKAQMFDALIDHIESALVQPIVQLRGNDHESGLAQVRTSVVMMLSFAEHNRGLTRLLTGDALSSEDGRLQDRMNQLLGQLENTLRQGLRAALLHGELPVTDDQPARANLILNFIRGRWQHYASSAWQHLPTTHLDSQLDILLR